MASSGRFIYDKTTRQFVPAEEYRRPPATISLGVMNDIAPFRTTDGVDISSRSSLREYERSRGVRQCGNEWTGSGSAPAWFPDAIKRAENRRRG